MIKIINIRNWKLLKHLLFACYHAEMFFQEKENVHTTHVTQKSRFTHVTLYFATFLRARSTHLITRRILGICRARSRPNSVIQNVLNFVKNSLLDRVHGHKREIDNLFVFTQNVE